MTGAECFAAYNAGGDPATAGLDWRGNPCPAWEALPENVRAKWEAVASAKSGPALAPVAVLPVGPDADARVEEFMAARHLDVPDWMTRATGAGTEAPR